jgi:hypothetical protein
MAYTINLTDGAVFAVVADGTINTSSSMILVGKNYAGYGEFLDENFIHLLESGANTTAPAAPLTGQLWWDKTTNTMKVYNGTTFKVISASTASPTQPSSNVAGDLWFDETNQQLKVYNGSTFILVGPASSQGQGTTGAIAATLKDNSNVDHTVLELYVANTIVGIVSVDSFTPQTNPGGFSTISPGIQLSSTVSGALFQGTAINSQQLGGVASTNFLRNDQNGTTSGTLGVINDAGLTVGLDQDAKISVTTATSAVNFQNQTQDANINMIVNDGGVTSTVMAVNGATATVNFPNAAISVAGITNNNSNGVGNLGSSSSYFNTVFATATTALYADVAERFAADEVLTPGTVVELGGTKEITRSLVDLSDTVFGVISTRPAYTMNGGAGDDDTHPKVAMTGRVPVQVIGIINKGDRLVSAGNGLARAAKPGEATAFNVIGRALESKLNDGVGMVEAIVTIK